MTELLKVLVTCPPMLGMIDEFAPLFKEKGMQVTAPRVVQTLPVEELCKLVPQHDGWIIGDDPATREVFKAGKAGRLKAAIKWGIGVDNVDFEACKDLDIPIKNTPNMFGNEVADMALGYVIALARETFQIDAGVRQGDWPKPRGISLEGRVAAVVGFGDIGRNTARRLMACGMRVIVYDPYAENDSATQGVERAVWPQRLSEADFIVLTCALTPSSRHMINAQTLEKARDGVRIVNVGRGPVIEANALDAALEQGKVYSAALDVFEIEPLPAQSYLRKHPRCVLGSHNASNTADAVVRTSQVAITSLAEFLSEI